MSARIDLNADLGEGFSLYRVGDDAALLRVVTSCSVACGMHAGDPPTMRRTVQAAVAHGVAIGAHPSWPDRQGFGRREMRVDAHELHALVVYQIGALTGFVREAGARLAHVKAHGALYHQLSADAALGAAFIDAVRDCGATRRVYAQAGSAFARQAAQAGLDVVAEAFVDRAYTADGALASRARPGAVLTSDAQRIAQALSIAQHATVRGIDADGTRVDVAVAAGTLCLHGDSPGAAASARTIRAALEAAGVQVTAPPATARNSG
ncbi:MAG: LamB/YcsF family protein [Burkholderiales bacterium]|nr:LamB/YcsF family protein [Burkholderiales bacterium]